MTKNQIRKLALERRSALKEEQVKEKSEIIIKKIEQMEQYIRAENVLFYYPYKNEVDLIGLVEKALKTKNVYLPYVENDKRTMTARKIEGLDELKAGKYGIMSPDKDATSIEADKIDFIAVPLVAYDDDNNRIGYGGGYYDTYLKECHKPYLCGVAFECQKADNIGREEHDIKLHIIVTE